jgi:hypothetical protein
MAILTTPQFSNKFSNIIHSVSNILVPGIEAFPNNFIVIQITPLSTNSYKWIYKITNVLQQTLSTGELLAVVKSNGELRHTSYGRLGDLTNFSVEPIIISSNIGLRISNSNINELSVNVVRLTT